MTSEEVQCYFENVNFLQKVTFSIFKATILTFVMREITNGVHFVNIRTGIIYWLKKKRH